jgi:hypothetical protein
MASRFAALCRIWFEVKPPASSRRQGMIRGGGGQKHAPARPRSQLCPQAQGPAPDPELPTGSCLLPCRTPQLAAPGQINRAPWGSRTPRNYRFPPPGLLLPPRWGEEKDRLVKT